jgi:UDP-N-acetylglucosamine diphosphorylase/glucosamine-1-phosphate N-acetyltransferase
MNTILFDKPHWIDLLPLTYTRPVPEIRVGILKISEKWERYLGRPVSFYTQPYLQHKYALKQETINLYLNGAVLPNSLLLEEIAKLKQGQVLKFHSNIIAFIAGEIENEVDLLANSYDIVQTKSEPDFVQFPWDIFLKNGREIEKDYLLITKGRNSCKLATSNRIIGDNIFVEDGVIADFATINAKNAFVYLGKNAEIMDGTLIKGSLGLGEGAVLKMGAKIYGPTTIGPGCRAGGEISNSVLFANSNKGHDGFIGNSVLGEWCNLGADTNSSNLKNNYAEVKVWNYKAERFIKTGLQFCGLIMGDHSKSGINTMFNTGTVVGVSANIFGAGYPRNFIPSFVQGGYQGFMVFPLKNVFETCEIVMKRRNTEFSQIDRQILQDIFEQTRKYRK